MTKYIIHNGRRLLSYFYPNNNFCGKLKDIIGFSNNNFIFFTSEEEAHNKLKSMFSAYNNMEGDLKLSIQLFKTLEKLKISEYN